MQKQLADGLILRTLSEGFDSDREQLPHFNGVILSEGEPPSVAEGLAVWTQDLINNHPLTTRDDIFVVVDPSHDDRIVSSTLLIPQTWQYEEIPIAVGRPELVGTHPDYRGRGLVRQIFEAVHERSAALGHQLQVITGIPYFYRQFGYTMALDLGERATLPLAVIDDPTPDYIPQFTLRAATVEDIGALSHWFEQMARERLVTVHRSVEQWQHEVAGHSPLSLYARSYQIIVNREGEGVGCVELPANVYNKHVLPCFAYVVGDQASYVETFDDVMRAIRQWATEKFGVCPTLLLLFPGGHTSLYTLFNRTLGGDVYERAYKWYLRVPDTIAFLKHIQPVLERRLEGSGAHRFTGELKIGFFDLTGVEIKFERGRIVEIVPVRGKDGYGVSFPWHLFWNVVFGHHSADEINAILPDVWTSNGRNAVLMDTLFPKKESWVRGQG